MGNCSIVGPKSCSGIVESVYDMYSIDSCINYHQTQNLVDLKFPVLPGKRINPQATASNNVRKRCRKLFCWFIHFDSVSHILSVTKETNVLTTFV